MRTTKHYRTNLGGRNVDYDVVVSKAARQLRVRIGPFGIIITRPDRVDDVEARDFLHRHQSWVLSQLDRVLSLHEIRKKPIQHCKLMFRGVPTSVRIEFSETKSRGNIVKLRDNVIVVRRGSYTQTPAARGLENWLRKQARIAINRHVITLSSSIGEQPGRVYIMDQRTKWGNCSALRNLSFNWRLILAPDFVLRYIVTHEVVHLAIPDHSTKYWLTVQSHCPEAEQAKHWLSGHYSQLNVDLGQIL